MSFRPKLKKQITDNLSSFFLESKLFHCTYEQYTDTHISSYSHIPALHMYFVVIAALDRKLFTCSTSSPIVEPAPSWNAPPHLI